MLRREVARGVPANRIIIGGFAQASRQRTGAVFVCHGKDDEVVPFAEGERTATLLRQSLGTEQVTFNGFPMKHGVASDEMVSIMEFIDSKMAAPAEPLSFDPAEISREPAPPPEAAPVMNSDQGAPGMDPQVTLDLLNDEDIAEAAKDPEGMAVIQDVVTLREPRKPSWPRPVRDIVALEKSSTPMDVYPSVAMHSHAREKCHLEALLYCVFDKDAGPIVQCADPVGAATTEFQLVGHYLIPDSVVQGRVVSVVCGDHVMMGTPVYIEDNSYFRNCFQFNICMVIDATRHHEPYRDIAQLLAMSFQTLEVETKLLSNPREGTSIQAILTQLRAQLNESEECFVTTDSCHAISFKVRRWTPALTKIEDETAVPVPLLDLQELLNPERSNVPQEIAMPFSLDPALAAVLPLIDGVRSVQTIAQDSPLRSDYVKMILRHLLHFDLIHLIPSITLDSRYRLTPAYHTVLEDAEKVEEAVRYITAGSWNGEGLAKEEKDQVIQRVMALYALVACEGKPVEQFKQEEAEEVAALNISLRHFITWGLLQGYLERVEDNVGSLNKAQADELFQLRTEDIPKLKKHLKEKGWSGQQVNQDSRVKEMVKRMVELRDFEA
ncbi:unnamed protein product [Effrenium voratum]|nr:unnamed protein product [Effrenium voratum]